MVKGNHIFLLLCLGLCLVTTGVWGQNAIDAYQERSKVHLQWLEQFRTSLESSEHAQLRTATAIHLNQTGDLKAKERSDQLIAGVLDTPNPNPESLWLLASDCRWRETATWCEPGGVYEMLLQADPENAAVLMLRFSQASFGHDKALLDSEANRQLLFKAAESTYFDAYSWRSADQLYEEALKYVKVNPQPPVPELEDPILQDLMKPHVYAFAWVVGLIVSAPVPGYSNLIDLCRSQARKQHSEGVAACKKLARILRENSNSLMTSSIGFAIERTMLEEIDPDDPGVQHWQLRADVFQLIYMCQSSHWQTDEPLLLDIKESSLMNRVKNQSDLGEWQGNRLTAFQEYAVSADNFTINPMDCEKLNDLDDEAIEKLLNGRNPVLAWKTILTEAWDVSVSK